ncbi:MAG: flavodoxin family protein [Lachnospiraceae bacterium]|nr:flavodoxin family protein [Lachnospiraceae bacterium]
MNILVLFGSPRKDGNTWQITEPFIKEAEALGADVRTHFLYDKNIIGCTSCRGCQENWDEPACVIKDDMTEVFDDAVWADMIVLSTPIYSWFCTAPMKAVLDRLMYGMNKFYGENKGPTLFKGKSMAIITTCGYKPEKGADVFEEAIKRYCKHVTAEYKGMFAERFLGYKTVFMTEEKELHAKEFARVLIKG